MSHAPLRRWIVRRSHFPLALPGEKLGIVEASDATTARMMAVRQFECATVIEPEHPTSNPQLERVVNRAVKSAGRRDRAGAYGHARRRSQPMNNPDGDAA